MAETPKYFICLFKKEGHTTWRIVTGDTLEQVENSIKLTKAKITARKFFEIDRLTGEMEEF